MIEHLEACSDCRDKAWQSTSVGAAAAFRAGSARGLLGEPLARCLELLKQSEADRFAAWCARHGSGEAGVTDWEQREYFEAF